MEYHFDWTLGSASHWTNFQAVSRFLAFLNTTRFEPPTNEELLVLAGTVMTSYWSLVTPTFSTADIIHGPEMNIGTRPLLKSGSVVGVLGAALSEMPSVKSAWQDPAISSDKKLATFGKQLETAQAPPTFPTWEQVVTGFDTEMEKVTKQGADPAAALKTVQQQAESIGTGQ